MDWSSDVCSSDLAGVVDVGLWLHQQEGLGIQDGVRKDDVVMGAPTEAKPRREDVQHVEAGIVRRVPVTRSGVSDAAEDLHRGAALRATGRDGGSRGDRGTGGCTCCQRAEERHWGSEWGW